MDVQQDEVGLVLPRHLDPFGTLLGPAYLVAKGLQQIHH